jgi:hypothetical protein
MVLGAMVRFLTVLVVPVPLNGIFRPGPEIKRLPPVMPAAFGAKKTFKVTLAPATRTMGKLGPLTEKLVPTVWNALIVSLHGRALVSTIRD